MQQACSSHAARTQQTGSSQQACSRHAAVGSRHAAGRQAAGRQAAGRQQRRSRQAAGRQVAGRQQACSSIQGSKLPMRRHTQHSCSRAGLQQCSPQRVACPAAACMQQRCSRHAVSRSWSNVLCPTSIQHDADG
eukprot:366517-Chlamydomonas_euryale.AAC.17